MANKRDSYSDADNLALLAQVDGHCPLCGKPLLNPKAGKTYKRYDIAHIYPLNPSDAEVNELRGLERLSADVNSLDNVIPLCPTCHRGIDHPRTAGEYLRLIAIKKIAIEEERLKAIRRGVDLRDEIFELLDTIAASEEDIENELVLVPKKLGEKVGTGVSPALKNKVRRNVAGYYRLIQSKLKEIERENPGASDEIFHQARGLYLKLKASGTSKEQIVQSTAAWIRGPGERTASLEAAEAVTAFFIQNCEVLE